jgi:hypothetical protein
MLRGVQFFFTVLNLAALFTLGVIFWKGWWVPTVGPTAIEYKDFVSIVLTALALMIAMLAAFLAALAVYGFQFIRKEAQKLAESEATRVAKVTAETVASRAVMEFLEQTGPAKEGAADYGKIAGEDKGCR